MAASNTGGVPVLGHLQRAPGVGMNAEDFREAFKTEIKDVLARAERQYSLSDEEVGRAVYASVSKYLPEAMAGNRQSRGDPSKNGKIAASREAAGSNEIRAF